MSSFVNLVTLFIFAILVISLSSPQFPLPPQVSEKALIPLDLNEEELKKLAGQTVKKGDKEYIIVVQVTCTLARLHACTLARLHACTLARLHACTLARMHACTHARMHACTPAHLHTCKIRGPKSAYICRRMTSVRLSRPMSV